MAQRVLSTVLVVGFVLAGPAYAEIHKVDITLFMPCDNETAVKAAASLRAVPGVTNVDLVAGKLEVSVETGREFTRDPLELVQKLWDGKIYPNKIYLEASGRIQMNDGGFVFHAADTGQRFKVRDDARLRQLLTESSADSLIHMKAEVVDWVEDQQPGAGQPYTLRVLEYSII